MSQQKYPFRRTNLRTSGRRLGLLLAIFCVSSTGQAQTEPTQTERSVTQISYTQLGKGLLPIIPVKFKQGLTTSFAFDLGSDFSFVFRNLVTRYGWTPEIAKDEAGEITVIPNGPVLKGVEAEFALGTFDFHGQLAVFNNPYFDELAGKQVNGIIGNNLLGGLAVLIDPQNHSISLYSKGNLTDEERKKIGFAGIVGLPNQSKSDNRFQIEVVLNGTEKAILSVDSGDDSTFLPYESVEHLHLKTEGSPEAYPTAFGEMMTERTTVTSILMGNVMLTKVQARYAKKKPEGFPVHLGNGVLSQFKVLLDYPARKIYLKPIGSNFKWIKIKPND